MSAYDPRPEHQVHVRPVDRRQPGARTRSASPPASRSTRSTRVHRLAEIGAGGVSLHDNDLVPVRGVGRRARPAGQGLRQALRRDRPASGWRPPTCSPTRSSRRARSPRTTARCGASPSRRRCARSTSPPSSARGMYVFWGGREGAEIVAPSAPSPISSATGGARLPLRLRAGPGLRHALRARAEAERAARRLLLATVGHALGADRRARAARDGRPEPRGGARDDGRAELQPGRRDGAVGREALPHRPERAADRPLRPGLPLRPGGPEGDVPAGAAARGRRLRRRRATSTPTRCGWRTPRASGTSPAAACGRT